MSTYPWETRITVRFRDVDSLDHVNNAVIITYIEQARTEVLVDLLGLQSLEDIQFILARIECDYKSPIRYGESVTVDTRIDEIGDSSLTLAYRIRCGEDDRIAANAETVVVFYDYDREETIPVPDSLHSHI